MVFFIENRDFLEQIEKLNKKHRRRRIWQRITGVLAGIVVFCTTYALILPAITMENETVCGLEEHIHSEACITVLPVPETRLLSCGYEGHRHSDSCYDAQGALICGLADFFIHDHDSSCRDENGELVCALDEILPHSHEDECYEESVTYSCGLEESEGHSHGDECYETVRGELICTEDEYEGHSHTDECRTLICSENESEGHSHSDGCRTLVCTEEHEHAEGCYEISCGIEENAGHSHSEGCYEISCGIEETAGHSHGDGCWEITCGIEETAGHSHSGGCYETVCGIDESAGHSHGDECYEVLRGELICTETEHEAHSHGEDCGAVTERRLICTKDEVIAHSHTAACRDEGGALICGMLQITEHSHGEDCFTLTPAGEETVYTCGLEEHSHNELCFPAEDESAADGTADGLICAMGEHSHSESCYNENGTLMCTMPEHSHDEGCYAPAEDEELSDPTADVETAAIWEATLPDRLSGIWADDVLAVARSQLGYTESRLNFTLGSDGVKDGYTRYGDWYGDDYGEWCAMFVSFCLHYADVDEDLFPIESSCSRWVALLDVTEEELAALSEGDEIPTDFYRTAAEYSPVPGDIIFFDTDGDGTRADHVGIVADVIDVGEAGNNFGTAMIKTIEGNKTHTVSYFTYALDDACILGYGVIPANEDTPAAEDDAAAEGDTTADGTTPDGETAEGEAEPAPGITLTGLAVADLSITAQEGEATPQTARLAYNGNRLILSVNVTAVSEGEDPTGRIALEYLLPADETQARFDLDAMGLGTQEEGVSYTLTTEERLIDSQPTMCQMLTVYLDTDSFDAQGVSTHNAVVEIAQMAHRSSLRLYVRAAAEHEPDTAIEIKTESITVIVPMTAKEQQAVYDGFAARVEELEALDTTQKENYLTAQELLVSIEYAYEYGELKREDYLLLSERIDEIIKYDLDTVAERAEGTNWIRLRDSGWFEEYSAYAGYYPYYTPQISATLDPGIAVAAAAPTGFALRSVDADVPPSDVQVTDHGGSNASDDSAVIVSKTISGTDTENVFDITLTVQTSASIEEVYEEPDMAVVIVMDISRTMNSKFGDITRYAAAMAAAEDFLDQFAANSNGVSLVGYVAFNTSAHEIFGLTPCSTTAQANALKNTMRTETGSIINDSNYANLHTRFTNVEAGLKMAADMLADVDNDNKYIIFLSDGFPTTYIESGYTGYDPYTDSGTPGTDGVFYDAVRGVYCVNGTSYSDTAAIRARQMATQIKNSGIKIFSIGVDIGGQTIQYYIDSNTGKSYSVVERTGTTYEIGDASSKEAYQNWLRNSIGSGYYYDSTDSAGLQSAYDQIFAEILRLKEQSSSADWVANDPLPTSNGISDSVEFIGFYNQAGELVFTDLSGSAAVGGENTAAFDYDEYELNWDLKTSGYVLTSSGGVTIYSYELVYRVRLKNEESAFTEGAIYPTNEPTTLTYKIFESENGVTTVSERRTVSFPIPSVHGYLSELSFTKVDSYGRPVVGAGFTLSHDTESCPYCRGDYKSHVDIGDFVAVSDENGVVTFSRIPSGHIYTLTETAVPEGYIANGNSYRVTVAYDVLTVEVTDGDGNSLDWGGTIENITYYELPATGGPGTYLYTIGGLLTSAFAGILLLYKHQRRRKGAYNSS